MRMYTPLTARVLAAFILIAVGLPGYAGCIYSYTDYNTTGYSNGGCDPSYGNAYTDECPLDPYDPGQWNATLRRDHCWGYDIASTEICIHYYWDGEGDYEECSTDCSVYDTNYYTFDYYTDFWLECWYS
jgi:hypothetical protein